jgi:DMSO/TMAO reductase YedYZ molybdopterin-dependent catalytic subunit
MSGGDIGTDNLAGGALSRRRLIGGLAAGGGSLLLAGCDSLNGNAAFRDVLKSAETLNQGAQRLIADRNALAREFSRAEMSPDFRSNGSRNVDRPDYAGHVADGFARWQIPVRGLVQRPMALSMAQLRAMPQRTQITRHDCVEGWSAIGEWTGPQLGMILKAAGLRDGARFVVFRCADLYRGAPYYESIDLIDAFHPQTILAWRMNGAPLAVEHGAPVRMRIERQLGYKQAKFVEAIDVVPTLAGIGGGKGGFWEDTAQYAWYAGI